MRRFFTHQGKELALFLVCFLLFLWVSRWFILPLAWAGILSIALWPIYTHFKQKLSKIGLSRFSSSYPWLATLLAATALVAPSLMAASAITSEALYFSTQINHWMAEGRFNDWANQVQQWPGIGSELAKTLRGLGESDAASVKMDRLLNWTGAIGGEALSRTGAALACLFFLAALFSKGERISNRLLSLGEKAWKGRLKIHFLEQSTLIRSIFNGIVIVGVFEGSLFWLAYQIADLRHPALFGFLTGFAAAIPLVSPLIVAVACILVAIHGSATAVIGLIIFSVILLFVIDPIVRPVVSGRGVELPFAVMFVAMIAGLQTLGLCGIFIGPLLANSVSFLWKELQNSEPEEWD